MRIGIDLDLFKMLAEAGETGMTVSELVTASKADPALLGNILFSNTVTTAKSM